MKPSALKLLLAVVLAFVFAAAAFAQDPTTSPPPADSSALTDVVSALVIPLATKYPWVALVLTVVGGLRLLIKPVMSALKTRAAETIDTADDERLARAEGSWWFRMLAFLLDYTASIKLPPPKAKTPLDS